MQYIQAQVLFSRLYEASKKVAESIDIEIKHKQIMGLQKGRANSGVQSTVYFHVVVIKPFLSFYIRNH